MKKILAILLLLTSLTFGQTYPMIEEFNGGTTWTYNNGGGLQNYGGVENYATFNIGTTPYINGSTITIASPVYDFTSTCSSNITVSFPFVGFIEDGFDYMYFEYLDGGVWVTQGTFTGVQSSTPSYSIPKTTTRFRFRLVTDAAEPVFFKGNLVQYSTTMGGQFVVPVDLSTQYIGGAPKSVFVYYYDITRFTIDCPTPLPIELLNFNGEPYGDNNIVNWITATENNNDYFVIERSKDAINFNEVGRISGAGNSLSIKHYSMLDYKPFSTITYYRLTQTDYDGKFKSFDIIAVTRAGGDNDLKVIGIYNVMGQEVTDDYDGIKVYYFSNGSVVKKYKINER